MNDLSVLMPLAGSEADLASFVAADPLFPQAIYEQVATTSFVGAYANLRVTAFRFDPCFAELDPSAAPGACPNQLRLVFQPLFWDGSAITADDSGVHVFYSLTREQLVHAVDDMVTARVLAQGDADLGPLAVSPLVTAEGLHGPTAAAFASILARYASPDHIVRVTTFALELPNATPGDITDARAWPFQGFDVHAGALTPIAIAGAPPATVQMSLDVESPPFRGFPSPTTTSTDAITVLESSDSAQHADRPTLDAAFGAALRIENPHDHSPNTIDCVSCHMAQPARELVAAPLGITADGNPNAFVPSAAIPAADLAATTNLQAADGGLNIHAFSYRGTSPMINRRVINETAANLAYLQTLGL
jgi:hypothetical protein